MIKFIFNNEISKRFVNIYQKLDDNMHSKIFGIMPNEFIVHMINEGERAWESFEEGCDFMSWLFEKSYLPSETELLVHRVYFSESVFYLMGSRDEILNKLTKLENSLKEM